MTERNIGMRFIEAAVGMLIDALQPVAAFLMQITDPVLIIGLFIGVKALATFGHTVFRKDQSFRARVLGAFLVYLDAIRSIVVLLCSTITIRFMIRYDGTFLSLLHHLIIPIGVEVTALVVIAAYIEKDATNVKAIKHAIGFEVIALFCLLYRALS